MLCGELAAGLNETMERLARLEANLGPDLVPLALPLRQAMTDLCGHVDRAMGLLTEAAMIEPAPVIGFVDEARFNRLLELAGPDTSIELLHRMYLDLRFAREQLEEALETGDWAEVRAQTHVLVSLAGTVGAVELQRLNEALNGAAHRRDADSVAAIEPDLMVRLDALIGYVARRRDAT